MTTKADKDPEPHPGSSGGEPSDDVPVVDTVEVVETNQPMDEWGED